MKFYPIIHQKLIRLMFLNDADLKFKTQIIMIILLYHVLYLMGFFILKLNFLSFIDILFDLKLFDYVYES